jgi:type I restriction enzyme S subunit
MHIKTIGETSLYINDGNYSSKYPRADEFLDEGVPFLSAYNIRDGRVIWDKMKYISAEHHQRLKKGHIREGDVLLITRGSIGAVAYVTSEFDNVNINAQLVFLRECLKSHELANLRTINRIIAM